MRKTALVSGFGFTGGGFDVFLMDFYKSASFSVQSIKYLSAL